MFFVLLGEKESLSDLRTRHNSQPENQGRARETVKGQCATDSGLLAYNMVMDFFMKQIVDIDAAK